MKVQVRFRGLQVSEALRDYVLRRVRFQLSRFSRELSAVVVRVGDVNGPRGGVDKRCQVTVSGPRVPSATLQETSTDVYAAVGSAVDRIERIVGRGIDRARGQQPPVRRAP